MTALFTSWICQEQIVVVRNAQDDKERSDCVKLFTVYECTLRMQYMYMTWRHMVYERSVKVPS